MSDLIIAAKKLLAIAANAYAVLDDDVRRLASQLAELRVQRRKKAVLLREARVALSVLERRRPRD